MLEAIRRVVTRRQPGEGGPSQQRPADAAMSDSRAVVEAEECSMPCNTCRRGAARRVVGVRLSHVASAASLGAPCPACHWPLNEHPACNDNSALSGMAAFARPLLSSTSRCPPAVLLSACLVVLLSLPRPVRLSRRLRPPHVAPLAARCLSLPYP